MRRGKRRKGLVKLMASVSFLFRYRVGVILLKFARRRGRQVAPSAWARPRLRRRLLGQGGRGRFRFCLLSRRGDLIEPFPHPERQSNLKKNCQGGCEENLVHT